MMAYRSKRQSVPTVGFSEVTAVGPRSPELDKASSLELRKIDEMRANE